MNPNTVFTLRGGGRRRTGRRGASSVIRFLLPLLLILALATGTTGILRRQLETAAEREAVTITTGVMNKAVRETVGEYGDLYRRLIRISRAPDGHITAIETDSAAVSSLTAAFTELLLARIPVGSELSFPIGNLTGSDFFNGRGMPLRFRMSVASGIVTDIASSFTSVGINQTLHRLALHAEATVTVFLPGNNITKTVAYSFPLAETVIVGEVPGIVLSGGK